MPSGFGYVFFVAAAVSTALAFPALAQIKNLEIVTVSEGTPEFPRSSEGSVIELANGDLFMVWQRYEQSVKGSEDDAPNKLVSMRSSDGGRSWHDLRVEAVPEPGDVNVYSPNLIRLDDSSILFVYKRYVSLGGGQPTIATAIASKSYDECATFVERSVMWDKQAYSFASASIRKLSTGRLVLPVEMTRDGTEVSGCAVSDDKGRTWRVCPGWLTLPMRGVMEGHVEELKDGRLIMVMRNQLGSVFKAFSNDGGETWSKPQTTGMRAPESCPELVRTPGGRLMLVWNNSEYDPGFRSHYGKRSPLSIALSDDEGESFHHLGDVEGDPGWAYSNPGAYFLKNGKCVLNYWAVKYTPDWVMSGMIHLKVALFDLPD